MTPQEDTKMVSNMSEEEAKTYLRVALSQFRIIKNTVNDPMDEESFHERGHAMSYGLSVGFLSSIENSQNEEDNSNKSEGKGGEDA